MLVHDHTFCPKDCCCGVCRPISTGKPFKVGEEITVVCEKCGENYKAVIEGLGKDTEILDKIKEDLSERGCSIKESTNGLGEVVSVIMHNDSGKVLNVRYNEGAADKFKSEFGISFEDDLYHTVLERVDEELERLKT